MFIHPVVSMPALRGGGRNSTTVHSLPVSEVALLQARDLVQKVDRATHPLPRHQEGPFTKFSTLLPFPSLVFSFRTSLVHGRDRLRVDADCIRKSVWECTHTLCVNRI